VLVNFARSATILIAALTVAPMTIWGLTAAGAPPGAPKASSPPSAVPPPAVPAGAWLRVETPDFTLLGNVPEARLRQIAGRLDSFRAALDWLHPGSLPSPRETTLYVFKEARTGFAFTPALAQGDRHLEVNPQYDVPNLIVLAAPADDPPLGVLYHSYAHQFLDDNFPRLPLAIDEGLAEFDTGFAVTGEGDAIGLVNADHVRWLRDHQGLPLAELFTFDAHSAPLTTANGRQAFVAGSWALMHYLISGSGEKRALLPRFLAELQRGDPPPEAAQTALGMSLEQLGAEVARYVRGNQFLGLRIPEGRPTAAIPVEPRNVTATPYGLPAATPQPEGIRVDLMAPDEVLAALGDLLAHAGETRAADAEAFYRQALQTNPAQARAQAGLGYLRYTRDDFAGAVPYFEKALVKEPDAMSCYLLARSLLRINPSGTVAPPSQPTPGWLSHARDLLARAISLRPHFAAPYVTLGATHLLPDGDGAAGVPLLQQAHRMLPGNLVYLLLRQGDFVRAQKVIDEALVPSGDEAALNAARAAMKTFNDDVAARQSLYRTRHDDAQDAASEASRQKSLQLLRKTLAGTTDPAARARIEDAIRNLEQQPTALTANSVIESYNEAVSMANKRDYRGAIKLLEDLLPKVPQGDLQAQVKTLLERLKQDASRTQQPAQ
jgi:tetratricopeptide (TPR) repeat protein